MTTERKAEIHAAFAAKAADFKASISKIIPAVARVEMRFNANKVRGFFLACEGEAADLAELRDFMAEHATPKFTHSQSIPADYNGPACDFYTIA